MRVITVLSSDENQNNFLPSKWWKLWVWDYPPKPRVIAIPSTRWSCFMACLSESRQDISKWVEDLWWESRLNIYQKIFRFVCWQKRSQVFWSSQSGENVSHHHFYRHSPSCLYGTVAILHWKLYQPWKF